MNKRKLIPTIVVVITIVLIVGLVTLFIPFEKKPTEEGTRKALIVCSANDFYGSEEEPDWDGSPDSTHEMPPGTWNFTGVFSDSDWTPFGNKTPGSLVIRPEGMGLNVSASYTFNWNSFYNLTEYAFYNMSTQIYLNSSAPIIGRGARIGIQWLDSADQVVRTDWSNWSADINPLMNEWVPINAMGVCNNESGNEIVKLKLILYTEGIFAAGPDDELYYDDVIIDRYIQVNLTDPTDPDPPPPPPGINSDGFPAQALQAYWVLKNHGYSDDDIFLMLYYKDDADGVIDIVFGDIYPNDLIHGIEPAVIDVANESVTAARFKQELNVSYSGSFASGIKPEDQLIIYMVDHGSNARLGDGNATFHFEADGSFIDEFEFFDLVKEIDCVRMLICVDCCFSGNFLNENKNIGGSWYNLPNCIFVSASSNLLAWYWINNKNLDGFAGSWFFHPFWDQLDQGYTIGAAYNFAINWIPTRNPPLPVQVIQNPLIQDNLGIKDTWNFTSDPSL
jgi:hypothetical protein